MSQPDQAHASVPRARPAARPASAPLRVVAERVGPEAVAAPAPTGPAQLRAAFRDASAAPASLTLAPCPQPWPSPSHAVAPQVLGPPAAVTGADLVPARSLLPVPACPPTRPLLARLADFLTGRRDPAGRHRPGSIESPTWSMCTQRRRRSRWRSR